MNYLKFDPALINSIINLLEKPQVEIFINYKTICNLTADSSIAQGDPISPILFNIAMLPLICLLNKQGPRPFITTEASPLCSGLSDSTKLNRRDTKCPLNI